MINTETAKILDRTFYVTIECPTCHEPIMVDVNESLSLQYINVICGMCESKCKVDMFESFSIAN